MEKQPPQPTTHADPQPPLTHNNADPQPTTHNGSNHDPQLLLSSGHSQKLQPEKEEREEMALGP